MTRDDVQAWLDRYVAAWRSYDPVQIGALFADAAEYRYHPWDEPVRGRDAVVRSWTEPDGGASERDAPGTYDGAYEPWMVEGPRAVATGISTYWTDATRTTVSSTYRNVFLLAFDGEGRCTAFTEWFMQVPPQS